MPEVPLAAAREPRGSGRRCSWCIEHPRKLSAGLTRRRSLRYRLRYRRRGALAVGAVNMRVNSPPEGAGAGAAGLGGSGGFTGSTTGFTGSGTGFGKDWALNIR